MVKINKFHQPCFFKKINHLKVSNSYLQEKNNFPNLFYNHVEPNKIERFN
jgi:hypothetical protein